MTRGLFLAMYAYAIYLSHPITLVMKHMAADATLTIYGHSTCRYIYKYNSYFGEI